MNEAKVVCRELGYRYPLRVIKRSEVPVGIGKIWLDDVLCRGTEKGLSGCPHDEWGSHRCNHSEVAGVECLSEGKVECLSEGNISTICFLGEIGH